MPAPLEGSREFQLTPKAKPTTTTMKNLIGQVLVGKLKNATYQSERAAVLTKEIADAVKSRLKECNFPRFKYVVQVVIGEQRGEGVRQATAHVEALESRLTELQEALTIDNASESLHVSFNSILIAIHGAVDATLEKFRARCSMIDPVTKQPRFGPKMVAKVQDLLRRYDDVKLAVHEDAPLRLQVETKLKALEEQQEAINEAKKAKEKEVEEAQQATERAEERDKRRLEQEAQKRETERRKEEEVRVQALAAAAQKKRANREKDRLEEIRQQQEKEQERKRLNASTLQGRAGLEMAIEMLRKGTGSEAQFRHSIRKLFAVVNNICNSPENVAFRRIPKDNVYFHSDLGRFVGGYHCLLALGFKEMQQGDDEEPRSVFELKEPNLSDNFDAWSTWFNDLKEMQSLVESQL